MSNLTILNSNGKFAIDSREVADMVDKRHDNLLRDINGYLAILTSSNLRSSEFFMPGGYVDDKGESRPSVLLTRKGCDLVANKMTGEKGILFTASYVTKFEEMEFLIKKPLTALEALQDTVKVLSEHEVRINQLDEKVDNQITVTFNQAKSIQFAIASRIIELLGGKDSPAYKNHKGSYFQQLHRDIKDRLGVPSYRDIRKIDFETAINYIGAWIPKAMDLAV